LVESSTQYPMYYMMFESIPPLRPERARRQGRIIRLNQQSIIICQRIYIRDLFRYEKIRTGYNLIGLRRVFVL
jgi:hypothetical protein